MKVVIVCGSLRFYKEMMEVAEKTELEEALILDNMHKEWIKLAAARWYMEIAQIKILNFREY